MRCRTCDATLELAELPELVGEAGGASLEILGVKAQSCGEDGHPMALVYPDFPGDLLAALLLDGGLPVAGESGFLRKRTACGECGGEVGEAPDAELRCRVWVKRASPCTVTYRGPVVRCGGCGRVQLRAGTELEDRLRDALLAALGSAFELG